LSRSYDIVFLLFGDQNDVEIDKITEKAMHQGVHLINLKGKTTFRELGALIWHLDLLITNDSSPLHLAVALQKPVVALFGPTANWTLCPNSENATAVQSPAKCSPCYGFGRFPGCHTPICMAELSIDTVKIAIEKSLTSTPVNSAEPVL